MEELVIAMQDKDKHEAILEILHASLAENKQGFQLFFDAFLG